MSRRNLQDDAFRVSLPATPLRYQVTENIRTAIAIGRLKAGERMRERELCEMTGVSRTLVREALRQLESEGLIEVVAHRGPVVAAITREQAVGIYQVREVLESLAAELFAKHASVRRREELRVALSGIRAAYASDDPFVWIKAKNRIYDCIVAGSGNDALGKSLALLNARAMLLRVRSMGTPGRRETSLGELEELVDALVSGAVARARRAAVRHVREAGKVVAASFQAEERARSGNA